jgi:hypothetical protein
VTSYDLSDLLSASIRLIVKMQSKTVFGDLMADVVQHKRPKNFKSSWWWPTGVATSLAGVAVVAFRGCWHRKMSWPIGMRGYSYQVCLSCGVKRLFDEATFSAYGPFRYELEQLLSTQVSTQESSRPKSRAIAELRPPAS